LRAGAGALAVRARHRLRPAAGDRTEAIELPALGHAIRLRPGSTDWDVLQHILVEETYDSRSPLHEAALERYYRAALCRGDVPVIVDCGANIGLASIWYARRFPQARVFAVEPEAANFELLAANAAHYPNITALRCGISDRSMRITMRHGDAAHWAWRAEEDPGGAVETVTIPGLLAGVAKAVPLIVKVDVEGSEVALFRSNTDWTARTPLIVFESHDWMMTWCGTAHAVFAVLTQHRRDYVHRGENTFSYAHFLAAESGPGAPEG
ncbi:FkbM family methyltransferase, partial [Propylenella binzhouense]|uniref:FkbM family methyltransferase n=1 Tax=Propylenella binzhouense TaxID=2555902 RepID=UPI0013705994